MSSAEMRPGPSLTDIAERTAGFVGRDWVFDRIHEWLKNPDGNRYYLLTAEPGAGKTAIAARLIEFSHAVVAPPPSCPLFNAGFLNASHLCSANTGAWIDPLAFSRSIALQLARTHQGFASALRNAGDRSVNIEIVQNVERAGTVTGILIENLVLTGLNPQAAFNATFTGPLANALGVGDTAPITILVDGLDEALAFKGDVNILTLLSALDKLPSNVRFILTSRPDTRVLAAFPSADGFLLSSGDHDAENDGDVLALVEARLPAQQGKSEVAEEITRNARQNFLYVTFLLKQMTSGAPLAVKGLPYGIHSLYRESLSRVISLEAWRNKYAPVMGLLSVARESFSPGQLIAYSRKSEREISDAMLDLSQFIEEVSAPPAYRLYHQSVSDFLRERQVRATAGSVMNQFYLPAGEWHRAIANFYMPDGPASWTRWDAYGLRYTASHLAEAAVAEKGANRHALIERLVDLVTDERFVRQQLRKVDDLPALRHDLAQAVRSAARDDDPAAILTTTRAALSVVAFTAAQLRPEPLFDVAESGEVERAAKRVGLFGVSDDWSIAATLALAWWGSAANPAEARAVLAKVPKDGGILDLLRRYASAAIDGTGPVREIRGFTDIRGAQVVPPFKTAGLSFKPVDEARASAAVDRLGGRGANPELLQGPPAPTSGTPVLGAPSGSNEPDYLAKQDAPLLVAVAAANPHGGDRYLREYIAIHSGYQYVEYRNTSLWMVLESVLWHPDPAWVRQIIRELVASALAGSLVEFQETLPLTILAVQALRGKPDAALRLDDLRQEAMGQAARIPSDSDGMPHGGPADPSAQDQWASHKRRLAAHAEIVRWIDNQTEKGDAMLREAGRLLRSFAGFQAPACLALAESWEIVDPANVGARKAALDSAIRAAHNVQDPSFCLRIVSRCNAMTHYWWETPIKDLRRLANLLFDQPMLADFTALHYVGDKLTHRAPGGMNISQFTIEADSLDALSKVFRVRVADLEKVNPLLSGKPNQRLEKGAPVRIPDPGFATWIAARLSSAILANQTLLDEERVELLQLLVPIATPNATVLDRVLARLLMAARPTDGTLLDALQKAAGPAGIQHFATFEGNLPA